MGGTLGDSKEDFEAVLILARFILTAAAAAAAPSSCGPTLKVVDLSDAGGRTSETLRGSRAAEDLQKRNAGTLQTFPA